MKQIPNINPDELTRDDLYEIVRQYIVKELKLHDITIEESSRLARGVLDHLDRELQDTTPYQALMHLTQEYPEIMDLTLGQQEYVSHENDKQAIDYISYYLKRGEMDKIEYLIKPMTSSNE